MNADESLNKVITCLIEDYLGRLQVELYKAIKKVCARACVAVYSLAAAFTAIKGTLATSTKLDVCELRPALSLSPVLDCTAALLC